MMPTSGQRFARAAILLEAQPTTYRYAIEASLGTTILGGRGIDLGVTAGKLQRVALLVGKAGLYQWIALTDGAEILHSFRGCLLPVAVRKGETIGLAYLV